MIHPVPDHLTKRFELDPVLADLQREVWRTRAALRDLLDRRSTQPFTLNQAREQSRTALDRFVAELTERSLPVPRKIHAELDLLSRLCV